MTEEKNENSFFSGLIIGGLLGAAVAFFVGKEEGKQLEKLLRKKGKILLDNLNEMSDDVSESVNEKVEDVSQTVKKIPDLVVDQASEVKENLVQKSESVQKTGKTSLRRFFIKAGKKLAK